MGVGRLSLLQGIFPAQGSNPGLPHCRRVLYCVSLQVTLVVKKPPANAGDADLIPGSGRSPEEGMATHSSILAWRVPWTEEPGGLQSVVTQSWTQMKQLSMRTTLNLGTKVYKICSSCFCFYYTSFVTCGRVLSITWRTPGSFPLPYSGWVSFVKVPLYLGWPKGSFGVLDHSLWKTPNELFGQYFLANTSLTFRSRESTWGPQCCNELPQGGMGQAERKVTSPQARRAADSTTASRVTLRASKSAVRQ